MELLQLAQTLLHLRTDVDDFVLDLLLTEMYSTLIINIMEIKLLTLYSVLDK